MTRLALLAFLAASPAWGQGWPIFDSDVIVLRESAEGNAAELFYLNGHRSDMIFGHEVRFTRPDGIEVEVVVDVWVNPEQFTERERIVIHSGRFIASPSEAWVRDGEAVTFQIMWAQF